MQASHLRSSGSDVRRFVRACSHCSRPVHRNLPSSQDSRMDASQNASTRRSLMARISHVRSAADVRLRKTPGNYIQLIHCLSRVSLRPQQCSDFLLIFFC